MNSAEPSNYQPPPGVDTSVSRSARVWNYWLGGKDNYPVDHEAGDQFAEILPSIVDVARASRAFLIRAVRYLAGEAGIRQFLDVGTGLPTVRVREFDTPPFASELSTVTECVPGEVIAVSGTSAVSFEALTNWVVRLAPSS